MAEIVLTPGQRAAVESRGCALLVAAAAGSGKTRVLIDRVLDQVIREGRCVDEFLLITFTQAAAAELRGKLLAELNRRLAADPENRHLQRQLSRVYLAQISTVHSFCAALLRDYAHVLELPADFRLVDEQEAAALRGARRARRSRGGLCRSVARRARCAGSARRRTGRPRTAGVDRARLHESAVLSRSGCDGVPLGEHAGCDGLHGPRPDDLGRVAAAGAAARPAERCGHAAPRAGAC